MYVNAVLLVLCFCVLNMPQFQGRFSSFCKKSYRCKTWEFAAPYFFVFHILFTLRTRLIVLVGKGRLRSAEKWQFLLLFPHSDAPNGTYMVMAPQITSPLNISPVFALLTFFADCNRNCRIRKIAVLHPICGKVDCIFTI